jgi:hypothetical protein
MGNATSKPNPGKKAIAAGAVIAATGLSIIGSATMTPPMLAIGTSIVMVGYLVARWGVQRLGRTDEQ